MSIKRFKFVVCPREDIKNFIIDNFKIKTECIILPQFASSLSFFNIKGTEKKYDFIFIGRNSKPKGFLDLIDLAIRNPTTRIVVCGNIREKRYRDIKNIIFLGKVTKDIL
ncbi:MAG: hypothetical protein NTX91_05095, partial [candidate division SR1 bacterium]|nr:hypothetical protein [candidate division SR1 bacterium]